jgi:hypothetical protein
MVLPHETGRLAGGSSRTGGGHLSAAVPGVLVGCGVPDGAAAAVASVVTVGAGVSSASVVAVAVSGVVPAAAVRVGAWVGDGSVGSAVGRRVVAVGCAAAAWVGPAVDVTITTQGVWVGGGSVGCGVEPQPQSRASTTRAAPALTMERSSNFLISMPPLP